MAKPEYEQVYDAVVKSAAESSIGLAWLPGVVRSMRPRGMTGERVRELLLELSRAGLIELRPESWTQDLSQEDAALVPYVQVRRSDQPIPLTLARIIAESPVR